MAKNLVLLFVILACVSTIYSYPLEDFEDSNSRGRQCYDKPCSQSATGCKKITKTSEDKKHLNILIQCINDNDEVLDEHTDQADNPFGSNTQIYSTSFSNVYSSSGLHGSNINIHNNIDNHENSDKDVETF